MIQLTSITLGSDKAWHFTWDNIVAEYYRIVLNGEELDRTEETSYRFVGSGYEAHPPSIEVVAENELAVSERNTPFLIIQWWPVSNADYYSIYEFVSSSWIQRVTATPRPIAGVYTVQTPILNDQQSYQFKVSSVSEIGQDSTSREYHIDMVRSPTFRPADFSITYDETSGSIEITEV